MVHLPLQMAGIFQVTANQLRRVGKFRMSSAPGQVWEFEHHHLFMWEFLLSLYFLLPFLGNHGPDQPNCIAQGPQRVGHPRCLQPRALSGEWRV